MKTEKLNLESFKENELKKSQIKSINGGEWPFGPSSPPKPTGPGGAPDIPPPKDEGIKIG